jgi:hypothetical protein
MMNPDTPTFMRPSMKESRLHNFSFEDETWWLEESVATGRLRPGAEEKAATASTRWAAAVGGEAASDAAFDAE